MRGQGQAVLARGFEEGREAAGDKGVGIEEEDGVVAGVEQVAKQSGFGGDHHLFAVISKEQAPLIGNAEVFQGEAMGGELRGRAVREEKVEGGLRMMPVEGIGEDASERNVVARDGGTDAEVLLQCCVLVNQ